MRRPARRSIFDFENYADLDLEPFVKPYEEVKKELADHLYFIKNKVQEPYAFQITHRHNKDIFLITFATNKDKAKSKGHKYFKDNLHPLFIHDYSNFVYLKVKRLPQLDMYAKEKVVPIPEILKLGTTIPCSLCGKHHFELKDYENNRCFIIEGEGNMNSFTKGLLLCYDCKKKYFS